VTGQLHDPASLSLGKETREVTGYEDGWAPETARPSGEEKSLISDEN
jgi:hypothetical protein